MTVWGASGGAVVGGITVGGVLGSLLGTGAIPIPGLGTAVGAAVGASVGRFTGGILGMVGGGGVVKAAHEMKQTRKPTHTS